MARFPYHERMITLTADESRVLGVLIEKALTTPGQYPLTLNATTAGVNQKNNREPVVTRSEEDVLAALDGLRTKQLVREVSLSGSRVAKYRHVARETLAMGTSELVILAELLLRGPQTLGELRGRASRMHPLESLEVVKNVLDALAGREEPLVKQLPPLPGDRAERFMQLLCPKLHPLTGPAGGGGGGEGSGSSATAGASGAGTAGAIQLNQRVEALEAEVARLREIVERLAAELGA